MVVVHANTEKPYAEWIPAYVILKDGWLSWELYCLAKKEAEELAAAFWKEGRWGDKRLLTCRWRPDICEAIAMVVNDNVEGLKCTAEYPPWEETHCRRFRLVRK